MRIQHNIAALNSYRNLTNNNNAVAKNLEKLSSGYRINRAGDDAAGLAISEKMRAQITGLNTAQKNANDGISLVQTAEGAMTEVHSMLNRMVELANQSANGTYADAPDRENLQKEISSLKEEINRIADSTNFNGINLLDGSLDAESTANLKSTSAISNVTTSEYSAKGAAAAFESKYITNRPEAATSQTNASFSVSFDDVAMLDSTGAHNEYTVKIGDATFTVATGGTAGVKGDAIAAAIAKGGYKNAENAGEQSGTTKVADAETAKWDTNAVDANKGAADSNFIKIDGHWYKMAVDGTNNKQVNFTQVDYTGEGGTVINPDYAVEFSGKGGTVTGTTNWQVQKTTTGTGVGSSHQARVEVSLDFSKLKDGDVFTVGEKNYIFKVGENSSTTAGTGQTLVDLSSIFKTESDLANADKQALAMTTITNAMGSSTTWSAGNGGVKDGVGKLTFQSLSTYVDDATGIGGKTGTNDPKCSMDTEANVMAQFYGESKATNASVSFDLDVTKLKAGDTIKIDGVTFEFTDGAFTSSRENIGIDLNDEGINGGLLSSQTSEVMTKLQNAINSQLNYGTSSLKYAITVDGSKMTLSSNDNTGTTAIFENRTAAKVELSQTAYVGDALTLQIGDTSDDFNKMKVNVKDMHTKAMNIDDIDVSTQDGASAAVDKIKDAINYVSSTRGDLGAIQNRLEHTINNLSVTAENMTAAESRIRDVDMAEEMMAYTKNNILVQAAQAMLAQANQVPQGVLQLLQ